MSRKIALAIFVVSFAMILIVRHAAVADYVYPPYPTPTADCPPPIPNVPYIPNPSFECPGIPLRADVSAVPGPEWGYMIVESGSFAAHLYNAGTIWVGGGSYITGWTTGGPGVDYIRNASNGKYSVDYIRGPGDRGWIWTTMSNLVSGRLYDVSFDTLQGPANVNGVDHSSDLALTARVDLAPPQPTSTSASTPAAWPGSTIASQTYFTASNTPTWQRRHLLFIAPSTTATLTFHRYNGLQHAYEGSAALVDNLRISQADTAGLKVDKQVVVQAPAANPPPTTFFVNVDCSGVVNNTSYPIGQHFQFHYTGGNIPAQPMSNILTGSTCTISESPLPSSTPIANSGCLSGFAAWGAVKYPGPNGVITRQSTIIAPSGNGLSVLNTYACTPNPPTDRIAIEKTVINNVPNWAATGVDLSSWSFPVKASCGGQTNTYTVKVNQPGHVTGIPVGTTCHVAEDWANVPVPAVNKICPAGQVLKWLPATYSPTSGAVAVPGVVKVTNTLGCVTPSVVGPREATPQASREARCKSPMTLDPAHDVCACPKGAEARQGTCVKTNSFFDNVHVQIGVGSFGRGAEGGGRSGSSKPSGP